MLSELVEWFDTAEVRIQDLHESNSTIETTRAFAEQFVVVGLVSMALGSVVATGFTLLGWVAGLSIGVFSTIWAVTVPIFYMGWTYYKPD